MTFEGILKRISPTLKRITYKLNGHPSYFSDEDLYQEALLHLWQDFKANLLEGKTDSYILQGCYFHLKNYIRIKVKRVSFFSIDYQAKENSEEKPERTDIPDSFNKKEYLLQLSNKLLAETIRNNGLTSREKHILYLYAQGSTTRDIGKRMGVSHVAVVKMTARIREKCRKYLD
jgi:RNA polymerase sigma factor (sigma-70 family)